MPDVTDSPLTLADLDGLNYTILVPYNGTIATGGDSLTQDLNIFYTVSAYFQACGDHRRTGLTYSVQSGDICWILISSALVLLMIPGVGFFYSGLARRKSALSLIWLSLMSTAIVSFEWFFWGYSLTFSHSAGKFIGNLDNIGLRDVLAAPSVGSPKIPDLLFAIYQGMFASIT